MRSRFHPDARVDYVDALVYVEEQRVGYGEKFEAEVFAALERALQFPGSGAQVHGYPEDLNLRAFPLRVFRYSLMIGFESDEAIIYAVAHQHHWTTTRPSTCTAELNCNQCRLSNNPRTYKSRSPSRSAFASPSLL